MSEEEHQQNILNLLFNENYSHLFEKGYEGVSNYYNSNKTIIILFVVMILLFIILFISTKIYYKLKYKKYINCKKCFQKFIGEPNEASGSYPILSKYLMPPTDDNKYTYSMWLKVTNWYFNYGKWKHVFHHGSAVSMSCSKKMDWDNVKLQSPGIWLGPEKNDLRVVLSTIMNVPSKCSSLLASGQSSSNPKPSADTKNESTDKCSNAKEIAENVWSAMESDMIPAYLKGSPDSVSKCNLKDLLATMSPDADSSTFTGIELLEHVDLQNVPIGDWFQLGVMVKGNNIEIYINGRLMKTQVLVGTPKLLDANGYVGLNGGFVGKISNFRYYPSELTPEVFNYVYNQEAGKSIFSNVRNSAL